MFLHKPMKLTSNAKPLNTNHFKFTNRYIFPKVFKIWLTIGSYVSVHLSRYEACEKFGEDERCVRIAWGVAEINSSFLSALQTSQVLYISMNAQLTYKRIVL